MLHGLRHHYATTLAASGQVDLYTLQKLLTHKDSRMTQRYAHILDENLKKAANVAGMAFDRANNKSNDIDKGKIVTIKD
jgi:site-specific recombinase XerD